PEPTPGAEPITASRPDPGSSEDAEGTDEFGEEGLSGDAGPLRGCPAVAPRVDCCCNVDPWSDRDDWGAKVEPGSDRDDWGDGAPGMDADDAEPWGGCPGAVPWVDFGDECALVDGDS